MLVDLHAHYPMHVLPRPRSGTHAQIKRWRRARLRAQIVRCLSRFANYQAQGDEPGVTLDYMHKGDVGVIFSALYCPFDEIDLGRRYASPPLSVYFDDLVEQLEEVESEVASLNDPQVAFAHSPQELEQALAADKRVLIHSVEGAFHLGASRQEVADHVATLAARGVVCVTVAHLFWRRMATNSPALPFMPDWLYRLLFHQPRHGLTELGRAVLKEMAANGILIDVTHMSERAMNETFALLDEVGGEDQIPVVATHMAYRFGGFGYNLTDDAVRRIAKRGGVLGLIACKHYISNGLFNPGSFEDSFELLCRHIEKIRELTASDDHVAFGSDLDGYIKPALPGLEDLGRMRPLQLALEQRYGATLAERFSSGNALNVIKAAWGRPYP
jgi:microsomal dipeptidase-like Zn-dependent dipeptidase